ncbi:MAG: class I SAM-dependent DNA methyltransferase [Acidimicrobiales bacterium]
MGNRWLESATRRTADRYDQGWDDLARRGQDPHGEAGFVAALGPARVLDAGCGTGRVAIELARRGLEVTGVDLDPEMLAVARRKAPELEWVAADLAALSLVDAGGERRRFDVVVAAGNVMIFLEPGTEAAVVARLAGHLAPGGALVAGFQVNGHLALSDYDAACAEAGLSPAGRWATWDGDPWVDASTFAVSLHRRRP